MSEWFLPVFCNECGKTMPRIIADDPSLHSCAKGTKVTETIDRAITTTTETRS